ncbi:MAG: hypothetical protein P1V35_05450 [Planctomycetota bacterium]|nr:hypothetical protein [Planctomycetota bacterium]
MSQDNLKEARLRAIEKVDGAKTAFWICLGLTGLCEGGFLIALLWNIDWAEPLHRLLAICTGLIYGTLGLGVLALGAYNRWWALRIVQAVQLGPDELE